MPDEQMGEWLVGWNFQIHVVLLYLYGINTEFYKESHLR